MPIRNPSVISSGITPIVGGTVGSILFIGTGPVIAEDNANLFWDDTNNTIGIGTTRSGAQSSSNPTARIQTGTAGAMQLQLRNSTGATTIDLTATLTSGSIGATNSVPLGLFTVGNTQIFIQPGGNTVASFNNGAGGAVIFQSYADAVTEQIKLFSGQTNNLTNWTNASNTVLSSVLAAGNIIAPDGSATNPGFAFLSSPTQCGIFRAGTNLFGIAAGGGTAMTISNSGAVVTQGTWSGSALIYKLQDGGAGNSNRAGTAFLIKSGEGTGSGAAAYIGLFSSGAEGSGTSLQTNYEVARFVSVASAANRIDVTNAAASGYSLITAAGGTNAGITITGKGTLGVAAGNAFTTKVVALTDGATPALDASLGNIFTLIAAGNRTIAVPTNPVDGQKITIIHTASGGARTLALNTGAGGFAFGTDITALTATTSGLKDYIGCQYDAVAGKWQVLAYVKGFA